MNRLIIASVITLNLLLAFVKKAQTAVITFDDITTSDAGSIPTLYEGFTWGANMGILLQNHFPNYTYSGPYDPMWPDNRNYASYNLAGAQAVTISNDETFDLLGFYIAAWPSGGFWENAATSITVAGYLNGSLVGSVSMNLLHDRTFYWLSADFNAVNEIRLTSSGDYKYWIMDNFTFNEPSSVPEPITLPLLILGLMLLPLAVRRAKTANQNIR
jgi:hypothetical protein